MGVNALHRPGLKQTPGFHGGMKLAATILMKVGGPGSRVRAHFPGMMHLVRVKALLCCSQELCDAAIPGTRTGMRERLRRLRSFNLCVVSWSPPCLSPSSFFSEHWGLRDGR